MELFFAYETEGNLCRLDAGESTHCVKVLRHRSGDEIDVIDGTGTLYRCRLENDSPKGADAVILSREDNWNALPYRLTVACCPTKNNERFEWFVEKATELGVDCIVPMIGEHSERKAYKADRARRIALAATKQSLKARLPEITDQVDAKDFIAAERDGLKLIAACFDAPGMPRKGIMEALDGFYGKDVTVLIGPEGDFSQEEMEKAIAAGYVPVHLGNSRLRTETAAVTAVEAVYLKYSVL